MPIQIDLFSNTEPHPGTQHYQILRYLRGGYKLSGLDALKICGSMKLASRVSELKRMGHKIHSEIVHGDNGKHFCRYWI